MALPVKTKAQVSVDITGDAKRLFALQAAVDLAVASIQVGNSFTVTEVTRTADELLVWLTPTTDGSDILNGENNGS